MINFWTKLKTPFTVLAPMEEVTDMAFREMMATVLPKPDVLYTEFVNADGIIFDKSGKVLEKLRLSENQRPVVAQIWGVNITNLEKSAKIVRDLGFDGIDINMGCPVRDVINSGGGAVLIKTPALAADIIMAVKSGANNIPVSVKTRLGYDKIITNEWLSFLLEQNLSAISIHARTAKQLSKGKADWGEIGKIIDLKNKMTPSTIIIGNGDVSSYNEVLEKYTTYHVDGVMIGRGVLKNPFVFSKNPRRLTKEEKLDYLEKHKELINRYGGSISHISKIFLNDFPGAKSLRILYNSK